MTLCGIVLFNPDIDRLKENISSVKNQVDKLLLIDNGSKNILAVKSEFSNDDIEIVENGSNLGISKALAQIMQYAEKYNYEWVLTLDQDSVIDKNLIKEYYKYINIKDVGIITCNIIDRNFDERFESFEGKSYIEISRCITSASFMSTELYATLQGYNVELFIDMVDWDICAQFIEHGYKIIRINYDGILHEVGNGKNVNFFGHKWISFNHSAFREYYVSRNRFYLCKRYPKQYSLLKESLREFKSWIIILFYEKDKFKKIGRKIKGIMDCKKII